uniref:Spondin-like TSP1 domain-containing protein n=1 Tax=Timema douglasi TaxID=61478 RepID=A0A7R8VW16_TIMDO|nr:unnamed protein product [Timema douglasi]
MQPCDGIVHIMQPCDGIVHIMQPCDAIVHIMLPCDAIVHILQPCDGIVHIMQPCDGIVHIMQPCDDIVHIMQPYDDTIYIMQPCDAIVHIMLPCDAIVHIMQPCDGIVHIMQPCDAIVHIMQPCDGIVHIMQPCDDIVHIMLPCDAIIHIIQPCYGIVHIMQPCDGIVHIMQPCDGIVLIMQPCDAIVHIMLLCDAIVHIMQPCDGIWFTGGWSECQLIGADQERGCGTGDQYRHVRCMQLQPDELPTEVSDMFCDPIVQPADVNACHVACPGDCVLGPWSDWSECYKPCESDRERQRTRSILRAPQSSAATCPQLIEVQPCRLNVTCFTYSWRWTDYSSCLPLGGSPCGEGVQSRAVYCLRSDGRPVADRNIAIKLGKRALKAITLSDEFLTEWIEAFSLTLQLAYNMDNIYCADPSRQSVQKQHTEELRRSLGENVIVESHDDATFSHVEVDTYIISVVLENARHDKCVIHVRAYGVVGWNGARYQWHKKIYSYLSWIRLAAVTYLFGKGKATALKTLLVGEFNRLADLLEKVYDASEAITVAATAYFTTLYGQSPGTSLESARF